MKHSPNRVLVSFVFFVKTLASTRVWYEVHDVAGIEDVINQTSLLTATSSIPETSSLPTLD